MHFRPSALPPPRIKQLREMWFVHVCSKACSTPALCSGTGVHLSPGRGGWGAGGGPGPRGGLERGRGSLHEWAQRTRAARELRGSPLAVARCPETFFLKLYTDTCVPGTAKDQTVAKGQATLGSTLGEQ